VDAPVGRAYEPEEDFKDVFPWSWTSPTLRIAEERTGPDLDDRPLSIQSDTEPSD